MKLQQSNRSAEAVAVLRGRDALFTGLQHAGLQAQFDELAAALHSLPPPIASKLNAR